MTKCDIQRIIEELGYRCEIREYIGRHGIARDKVYARTLVQPIRNRTFGNLEDVMKLDRDEFAKMVVEKFTDEYIAAWRKHFRREIHPNS